MTTTEIISAVSATVAGLSLVFNIIQAVVIYKLNRRNIAKDVLIARGNMAKDDLKDRLKGLLVKLESTQLFTVPYNNEIWEYGFRSLEELVALCAAAHVGVQVSQGLDDSLRDAVSELHDHVKVLKSFRDSHSTFMHGKKGVPAKIEKNWPQLAAAETSRMAAGTSSEQCKRVIGRFLSQS